jgi:hypothetical protein
VRIFQGFKALSHSLRYVCLSVLVSMGPSAYISPAPTERFFVLSRVVVLLKYIEKFVILLRAGKHFVHFTPNMNTYLHVFFVVVADDNKLPQKLFFRMERYRALRIAEEV